MSNLQGRFEAAQAASRHLRDKSDNETLLELYCYLKQAVEGDAGSDRPGALDLVARAKYDAGAARRGKSSVVAMRGYIKVVEHLQSLEA